MSKFTPTQFNSQTAINNNSHDHDVMSELAPYEIQDIEIFNKVDKPRKLFSRIKLSIIVSLIILFVYILFDAYFTESFSSVIILIPFSGIAFYIFYLILINFVLRPFLYLPVVIFNDNLALKKLRQNIPSPLQATLCYSWGNPAPGIIAFDQNKNILYYQTYSTYYRPIFLHVNHIASIKINTHSTTETTGKIEKGYFSNKIQTKTQEISKTCNLEIHFQKPGSPPKFERFSFNENIHQAEQFVLYVREAKQSI